MLPKQFPIFQSVELRRSINKSDKRCTCLAVHQVVANSFHRQYYAFALP
jgi:hypothetical protein